MWPTCLKKWSCKHVYLNIWGRLHTLLSNINEVKQDDKTYQNPFSIYFQYPWNKLFHSTWSTFVIRLVPYHSNKPHKYTIPPPSPGNPRLLHDRYVFPPVIHITAFVTLCRPQYCGWQNTLCAITLTCSNSLRQQLKKVHGHCHKGVWLQPLVFPVDVKRKQPRKSRLFLTTTSSSSYQCAQWHKPYMLNNPKTLAIVGEYIANKA